MGKGEGCGWGGGKLLSGVGGRVLDKDVEEVSCEFL